MVTYLIIWTAPVSTGAVFIFTILNYFNCIDFPQPLQTQEESEVRFDISNMLRPLRIPFSRPCLALRTQFDVLTAPQLGLIPGLFLPFLAEMPDFGRTSPFRLAPVEQLFSN
ncbi:hypothetical protein [Pseudodesulfovibrio profundus]|uniref:hypothetical protein n=1 Tax=Pseudodesulfovibrio profundus TaxID=57320 RepID=UPI000BE44C20|nr:hypothetical protein [Pseudodesulfovibrio profundus]